MYRSGLLTEIESEPLTVEYLVENLSEIESVDLSQLDKYIKTKVIYTFDAC